MAREAERQWCGCSSCSLHGCGHGHAEGLPTGRRYQNKGCKAYELCAFNDGDRFCWTPQAHLVSKVYLKKHPTLPFCYTINAKDKKMVNDFVKARSS